MKQPKQKPLNIYTKISIITIITFLALFLGTLLISLIVKTVLINNSISETKNSVYFYADGESRQVTPGELKPELFQHKPAAVSDTIANAVKDNHGKIAGTITQYKLKNTISVIDQSVVEDFLLPAAAELSKTDIPIALPANMSAFHQLELDSLKELNPNAAFITIATIPHLNHVYLVDDGSDRISNFLSTAIHLDNIEQFTNFSITDSAVAKFDSFASAQSYLKTINNKSSYQKTIIESFFGVTASAPSPIGNTASIANDFITFYNLFLVISFALLIITLLVVLFCQLAEHHQPNRR